MTDSSHGRFPRYQATVCSMPSLKLTLGVQPNSRAILPASWHSGDHGPGGPDKGDQGAPWLPGGKRADLPVQDIAEQLHYLQVPLLVMTADIVGFAGPPLLQNPDNGLAVVLDIEPVRILPPSPLYRQRLTLQGVG